MIETFRLERFFAPYEFTARHLLCSSDCQTRTVGDLLDLEPELETRLRSLELHYSPGEGSDELRAGIAGLHDGLEHEQIVVVPGGGPSLELGLRALLRPGDSVVTITPCYQTYVSLPRHLGCELREVALREEGGEWHLDLEQLTKAVQPGTRAVIVNFPHNPTGYLPDRSTFEQVLQITREAGATLFSDEIFRFTEHDPARRLPSAVELDETAVALGGLSKSFGLPGLRVGWILSRRTELLEDVVRINDYGAKDTSAPSQLLAAAALRSAEKILASNMELALANLELAEAFFARNPDHIRWSRPRGGVVGLAHLVEGDARELFESLFAASKVLVAPGELFEVSSRALRLGFGQPDFPQGLALLEEHLRAGG